MNFKFVLALALSLGIATTVVNAAYAHEDREIAGVKVEMGFETEPPIEGLPNGIVFVFTKEAEGQEHDDAAAADDSMVMAAGVNINEHGALFGGGTIEPGASFRFEATHEFENLVIPFHNHLNHDATGEIHVMDSAPAAGSVTVEIHGDHFEPAMVMVQPDTAIIFTNVENSVQTVVSGLADGSGGTADAGVVGVDGLERTLRMEITHVASNTTRELDLEAVFGQDGAYKGTLIPTATGQYSVRLFGTIDGTEVDETFESGPGTFDDVIPATSIQFPNEIASAREIQGVARGAQDAVEAAVTAADDADSTAATALAIGIVGVVIGVLGLSAGGYALMSARRPS